MTSAEYQYLSQVLARESGLALGEGKEYLVESRLSPLAASLGMSDLSGLVGRLHGNADARMVQTVCEAMTTNESLFFRDGAPFDMLRDLVFPELMRGRAGSRRIRLWCCAAATGQEPYSVAMVRDAVGPPPDWTVELLATDFSREVLERASRGVYNHFEVQRGLPITHLLKFFSKVPEGWQVSERLRAQIEFRRFNLLDSFAGLGVFDVIFCRNVLIYFDVPTRRDVLARLARALAPDGYLFLGGSETVLGVSDAFTRVDGARTSVYRRA